MALPKIKHPTFKITVPSTKKKITIRPYTVREEKILLIAQQSEDTEDRIQAVKQVVSNCVVDKGFDVDKCPIFDIEYFFIKIRAISVNNKVELTYEDENDIVGTDPNKHQFTVDLNDVEIKYDPEHTNRIDFGEGVGAILRYPTFETMEDIKKRLAESLEEPTKELAVEALFRIYAESFEQMYDDDKVYASGIDFNTDEAVDFLSNLSTTSLRDIQKFFDTVPTIYYEIKYETSTGESKTIPLTGLDDFFIL